MVMNWPGWGITGNTAYQDPSFPEGSPWPDEDVYRTEQEDWARFYSQLPPFWQTRAPAQDVGQNLLARYLLTGPGVREPLGTTTPRDVEATFGQFLQDYPTCAGGDQDQSLADLRARAAMAAQAAEEDTTQFYKGVTEGTPEMRQREWLMERFGFGQEGASSAMRNVANLIALQRAGATPTGGATPATGTMWRGRMADAIRNAMAAKYQQRLNIGAPRESFLSWYLGQTEPGTPNVPAT